MPSPALPDSGFDRVAAFYDPLARLVYGRCLQAAQQAALDMGLPEGAPRLLIIGGGTGWVLLEVLRRCPQARVLYLEASPQMLARSQALLARRMPAVAAQVEFRLGTEAALTSSDRFQVIVTFFFLDLFTLGRLRHILERLDAARLPACRWLLVDFAAPQYWWQKSLLATMYLFFRLTAGIGGQTRPPIETELQHLGLRPHNRATFCRGLVAAEVWQ